jgi:hypothetical protein
MLDRWTDFRKSLRPEDQVLQVRTRGGKIDYFIALRGDEIVARANPTFVDDSRASRTINPIQMNFNSNP